MDPRRGETEFRVGSSVETLSGRGRRRAVQTQVVVPVVPVRVRAREDDEPCRTVEVLFRRGGIADVGVTAALQQKRALAGRERDVVEARCLVVDRAPDLRQDGEQIELTVLVVDQDEGTG